MHTVRLLVCLIVIPLLTLSLAWLNNRPQDVGPDVPAGKLMSLSFAPFREGFNPLEEKFPIAEHVDEDLGILADKTETVRTYSSLGGMEPVPALARKHGINVIQGAWLGYSSLDNRKEIQALIRSANANPDIVKRVIVGNEVLLRGEMKPERLIEYIREVKRQVKQPVSYADVWSMYMKYPQLIKEVDFITIHILPYWEDEPILVEVGLQHVDKVFKQVQNEANGIAPGKSILIGETGWPAAGRQRGFAVPSIVNEAKYIRGLIQIAKANGFDYNIVEAFNQPWKSELEGVVGANWGLISADRQPVFPLTGPVSENADWPKHISYAIALWLAINLYYFRKLHFASFTRLFVFLTLTQLCSVAVITLATHLWYTSYNLLERSYTLLIVVANLGLTGLVAERSHRLLANRPVSERLNAWLKNGYLFFALLALYKTAGLSINGRYLSFPNLQFGVAVIGVLSLLLCLALNRCASTNQSQSLPAVCGAPLSAAWNKRLFYALCLAIPLMIGGEILAFLDGRDFVQAHPGLSQGLPVALQYTLSNGQLLTWLGCLAILAIPYGLVLKSRNIPAPAI